MHKPYSSSNHFEANMKIKTTQGKLMHCLIVLSSFLYACEKWILTAEFEKRMQAFETRCHWMLLNISYKYLETKEDVHRKILAATVVEDGQEIENVSQKSSS